MKSIGSWKWWASATIANIAVVVALTFMPGRLSVAPEEPSAEGRLARSMA